MVVDFSPPGPLGGGGGGGGGFTIGSSSSSPPSLKMGSSLQLNAATEIRRTNKYLRIFIVLKFKFDIAQASNCEDIVIAC